MAVRVQATEDDKQTDSNCRTVMRTSQATARFDILHTVYPSGTQALHRQVAERLCCSVAGSCSEW